MAVRFEIYRDGQRVTDFTPVNAIPMGPESVPIAGDVLFRDGLLVVNRIDESALGVALLWDTGSMGSFHLETTRLVHRDRPYILNVELARARLMKIVQKQEDWNLFDFPKAEKFLTMLRESQNLFADALGSLEQPEEASRLADRSLAMAIDLSEQLAVFHGDLLINRRRQAGQFVRHIFGVRIDPAVQNQKYRDTVGNLDYAVVPMSWKQFQPEEQVFNTEPVDEWVGTLNKTRVPIIAGPVVNFHESEIPDWMYIWEHDFDTVRDLAYEYVQKIVQRYRRAVAVWNVVSGLGSNKMFPMSCEQALELTRLLVTQVKNQMANARVLVNISQPFGEYQVRGGSTLSPLFYAEMLSQSGIQFEGFGLELEMGVPTMGSFTRDLFQISCLLDRFSTLGKPVFLTYVNVPGRATPDPADKSEGRLDPAAAGCWRRPWDAALQAEWIDAVYKLILSKPYVESIAWGNLADSGASVPGGGLIDDMLQPKPAFAKLQELRTKFHQWSRK